MFAKLKNWQRVTTRYDRCAQTFFSAICIAATVALYLKESVLSLERHAAFGELLARNVGGIAISRFPRRETLRRSLYLGRTPLRNTAMHRRISA